MAKQLIIKNLDGINWEEDHYIPEIGLSFIDFINSKEIEVGDMVTIENQEECPLPLPDDWYCVTFEKLMPSGDTFFTEEPFSKNECIILFGNDFSC
jgi:hypothetical protein